MTRLHLSSMALALLLAGCSLAPTVPQPDIAVPAAYKEAVVPSDGRWKLALPADAAARGAWWEVFGDPALDALEAQAQAANPTLASAAARVKAARAVLRGSRADRSPQVGLQAGASRGRDSAASLGLPAGTPTAPGTLIQAGFGASYEIDLFRRVENSINAAEADAQAVEANYRSVLLALQADVATAYYALRSFDAEIAQLDETVRLREDNARLIDSRFRAGDVGELDLARSRTDLATVQAEAAALRGARSRLEHALALLIGQTPAQFSFAAAPLTDASAVPVVPPGLPSALLERRPDVAAAQRSMQAATARVGVVKAALFPALALTADAGYASGELSDLFKWSSRTWLLSAVMSLPIIDGGRNRAAVTRAEATLEGAVADYRGVVLGAFADVEDQLATLKSVREQVGYSRTALEAARRAASLADIRYRAGEDSYLQLIDTQRELLAVQRRAAQLRGDWAVATVGLIRALGGGWDAAPARGEAPSATQFAQTSQ